MSFILSSLFKFFFCKNRVNSKYFFVVSDGPQGLTPLLVKNPGSAKSIDFNAKILIFLFLLVRIRVRILNLG